MLVENKHRLNDLQLHLLKMFSIPIEENMLIEIKCLLSTYLYEKVISIADSEWDKRNYNNEIMDKWIYSEEQ